MSSPREVYQPHADHEESIERIVKHLGRDKLRRRIFDLIYGRGSKPKTITQIVEGLNLRANQVQLVRNQTNHLAKHKLISTVSIKPHENDGSRVAFGKRDFIMANKQEILRKNARPELLERTPTKRRPQVDIKIRLPIRRHVDAVRGNKPKLKILYLTASPSSQEALRTDAEIYMVQNDIRGSKHRDEIQLISRPAASMKSVLDGLNDYRPQIVHFSGHGGRGSIWLDDGKVVNSIGQPIKFDLLAEALGGTDSPPTLLVLNACDTLDGADVLLGAVKVVIAMSDSISDLGASIFASQFYAAIASGQPISKAFQQAKSLMKGSMVADAHLPEIIHRQSIDPKTLKLTGKR